MPQIKTKNKQIRKLLSVKDIAELDNCSEKTVRRAIAVGLLEVIRVGPGGRLIRIDPAAHAAYRQAQCW
ncbi:helix-turn-helix domain-containing protein [uncultured Ruegeria sp.]|uniref:helix-turn-helix domain-containing protein n=1 Tax=uncultured Ruegeria sp. TaxID=259304 RepID=UPI0026052E1C|nr:helix-turn-helix domain-containing protein [uncultured Ruegeria sp.]